MGVPMALHGGFMPYVKMGWMILSACWAWGLHRVWGLWSCVGVLCQCRTDDIFEYRVSRFSSVFLLLYDLGLLQYRHRRQLFLLLSLSLTVPSSSWLLSWLWLWL